MNENIQEVIPTVVLALANKKGLEIWTWAIRDNGDVVIVAKTGQKFVFEKEEADTLATVKASPPQTAPKIADSNWHELVKESEAKSKRKEKK